MISIFYTLSFKGEDEDARQQGVARADEEHEEREAHAGTERGGRGPGGAPAWLKMSTF